MERSAFIEGMSHAACTVSVVTTDGRHGKIGVTVSSMASVSADPPSLLICVHHQSKACEAIRENGVMCVNILDEDQSNISDRFAGRGDTDPMDNFNFEVWSQGVSGSPMLKNALVNFDCKVSDHFQFGSHYIFIGEVQDIRYKESGRVLVYANRAYGRTTQARIAPSDSNDSSVSDLEKLRVGCFVTLGPFFMPRLMSEYLTDHSVNFSLGEGTQQELLNGLESNEYDAILAYDHDIPENLVKHTLAEVSPHILLPADHHLAENSSISLSELAKESLVLLDVSPSRDYFTKLFSDIGLVPKVAFRSPSFEMVRGMVGQGLGYSLLISKPANNLTYDGYSLVTRPIQDSVMPGRIVLVHREEKRESVVVRHLVEYAERFFSDSENIRSESSLN